MGGEAASVSFELCAPSKSSTNQQARQTLQPHRVGCDAELVGDERPRRDRAPHAALSGEDLGGHRCGPHALSVPESGNPRLAR